MRASLLILSLLVAGAAANAAAISAHLLRAPDAIEQVKGQVNKAKPAGNYQRGLKRRWFGTYN